MLFSPQRSPQAAENRRPKSKERAEALSPEAIARDYANGADRHAVGVYIIKAIALHRRSQARYSVASLLTSREACISVGLMIYKTWF